MKGKPYIMDDGRIGHVELTIGDSLLMMADAFPEVNVELPTPGRAVPCRCIWRCRTATPWPQRPFGKGFVWIEAQNRPVMVDRPPSATLMDIAGSSTPEVSVG